SGAGLANGGATITVKISVLSNNSGGDCDPNGPSTSQGNNVVKDGTCAFTQPTDKQNTDPQLLPLANNGGPTQTHALPASSPAVDAGDNSACPQTDQRGLTRPFDGNFDGIAICDVGAFELRGGPPAVVTGAASGVSANGATVAGTVNPGGVPASSHFEYGTTTA